MNETNEDREVNTTNDSSSDSEAAPQEQETAQPSATDLVESQTEAELQESSTLEQDYMLVVCDYLPKMFYLNVVFLACVVFAFFYKLLNKHFSNFS